MVWRCVADSRDQRPEYVVRSRALDGTGNVTVSASSKNRVSPSLVTVALTRRAPASVSSICVSSRNRAARSCDTVTTERLEASTSHSVKRGDQSRPPGR